MKKCRRSNKYFEFCNANPKGYVTQGDCVTRALAVAFDESWYDVVAEQCSNALITGYSISGKENYERLLEQHGFEKRPMPKKNDGTLYTVKEYIEYFLNITYMQMPVVLSLPRHLTTVKRKNGKYKIYDTWNCGDSTVRQVYMVK